MNQQDMMAKQPQVISEAAQFAGYQEQTTSCKALKLLTKLQHLWQIESILSPSEKDSKLFLTERIKYIYNRFNFAAKPSNPSQISGKHDDMPNTSSLQIKPATTFLWVDFKTY